MKLTGNFRFTPSDDLKFEVIPYRLAMISSFPLAGWVQIWLDAFVYLWVLPSEIL